MLYTASQLGIKAPSGGFQDLGWYNGRQFVGGTFGEVNQIHPNSPQQGAGQPVSPEVNAQSAALHGLTPAQFEAYLQSERDKATKAAATGAATAPAGASATTPIPGGASDVSGVFGGGSGGIGGTNGGTTTINLQGVYQSALDNADITKLQQNATDLQTKIDERRQELSDTTNRINENPFLSEASRTGRIKRLTDYAEQDISNYVNELNVAQGKIEMAKADAKLKVDLATGQYNIDRQAKQDQLAMFNSLLSAGALDHASGADIASISVATGIPTSMIQSAIKSSNALKTQVITSTADDGTVTATVINTQTGEVIAKNNLGRIGNAQNGSAKKPTAGEQKAAVEAIITAYSGSEERQAQISPEDLYQTLLMQYPEAVDYLKENWTPSDIRAATS